MSASQFGQLLKHLRVGKGVTLAEVADGTGISVPMLSRMERGERLPSAETLESLARYFEVPADVLTEAVVAQHAQNRYPRSWDSPWRERPEGESTADASPEDRLPMMRLESLSGSTAGHHAIDLLRSSPPTPAAPRRAVAPSRDISVSPAFRARPIGELFEEVATAPSAALDDAVHAAGAAVRQLIREYERSARTLGSEERGRVDAEISRLRDALGSLIQQP